MRKIGLNFNCDNEASLIVWSPLAQKVKVKINQETYQLAKTQMGFWEIKNLPIKPGQSYLLNIDNHDYPDPASLFQPEGVHKASYAFDLQAYCWNDSEWKGISTEGLIIYELHTGTFTEEGTFDSIENKIGYLKDLGINAIELMPVAQFPGSRNWGYDGVYPFAVQDSYGGPKRLQHLVDVCHQKGLAVILDVVYNHLGPEGNYLPAFGPVFTDKYKTPWGQAINFDDEWSNGVRLLVIENALMWFRDFHIDGLRLDAVHAIKDFGSTHILRELKEKVKQLNEKYSRHHFVICESDLNDTKFISPFNEGGFEMDATWCDEFHHSIHSIATGEINGYYSDFGSMDLLIKSLNNAFVFDGNWSEHRKRNFGSKTIGIPGHKFVVFIQNHDQIGNRMLGERLTSLVNFELLKVMAGIMLMSPFIPLLFMGEEYGETQPFLYFISHGDKELIRLVREGRKKEFESFMDKGETPDPNAEDTFLQSKLNWKNRNKSQKQLYDFYKTLINFRKTLPALKNTNRNDVLAKQLQEYNALSLIRKKDDQEIMTLINFEDREIKILSNDILNSNWKLLLNSADSAWGGPGTLNSNPGKMSLSPQSINIFIKINT